MFDETKVVIGGDTSGANNAISTLHGKLSGLSGAMPGFASAVAAGFSISAIVAFTKSAIDSADGLQKLSQRLGIGVETLAGYTLVAEMSGTTMEAMGGSIKKLSLYMKEHSDKLRAAGITATTTDGAMVQLAELFSKMPDGVQKTALAVRLFGESGTDMIPVLNQGSAALEKQIEKGRQLNPVTQEMADRAAKFNDNMSLLKATLGQTATVIAADLLPVLGLLSEDMAGATGETGSLGDVLGTGLAEALRAAVVLGGNLAFVFRGVGAEIGGISAQMAALASADFKAFSSIGEAMKEDAKKAREEFDAWERRMMSAGSAGSGGRSAGGIGQDNADSITARLEKNAAAARARAITDKPGEAAKDEKIKKVSPEDIAGPDANLRQLVGPDEATMAGSAAIRADEAAEAKAQEQLDLQRETQQTFLNDRVTMISQSLATEAEMEQMRYEQRLGDLALAHDAEIVSEQEYLSLKESLVTEHEARRGNVEAQAALQRKQFAAMTARQQTEFALGQMLAMSAGAAQHNRTYFEINKYASIGLTVMKTHEAAMSAYAWASKWGGPPAGTIAAGLAIGAGVIQADAIRKQQFGGGASVATGVGGAGTVPLGVSPTTPDVAGVTPTRAPATQGQAAEAPRQVSITLIGSAFSYKTVAEELIPLLNEAISSGNEIIVNGHRSSY